MESLLQQIGSIRSKLKARDITLNPPLSEAVVAEFEERHGIRLPEEYRLFLIELGDGGPGPAEYGLVPLGQLPIRPAADLGNVTQPFPFTRIWLWDDDESDEGSEEQVRHGSIYLGTDGCAMYWHLIVTGAERGIPWMVAEQGIQPVCPRRHFLQWYEGWLDGRESFYGYPGA